MEALAGALALPSRSLASRPPRAARLLGPGRDAELGVCADDMGIVLWDFGLLALIEPHFQAMERLACLHL